MPKRMVITIEVPSGSRAKGMFPFLNKLLEPHRMKAVIVQDLETNDIVQEQSDGHK